MPRPARGRRAARPPGHRLRRVLLGGAALLLVGGLAAATLGGPDADEVGDQDGPGASSSTPEPSAAPLPSLDDLDLGTLDPVRGAFCDLLAPGSVDAALALDGDTVPPEPQTWADGEKARLEKGLTDVAHEYGCAWRAEDRGARAWVLAPPVTPATARGLVRAADAGPCRRLDPAPAFGSPSYAVRCPAPGGVRLRAAGLFGASWLTCEVTVPDPAPATSPEPAPATSPAASPGAATSSATPTATSPATAETPADALDHWCAAVALATTVD